MFLVKQEKFFASLHTQMDLLTEASRLLLEGGRQGGSGSEIAETIDRLRGQAAELSAEIARELSRTLITPIDPEDILRLSSSMRRLVETLGRAASRQQFCPCKPAPAELVEEMEIIHECSLAVKSAFGSFRNGALARHCDRIGELRARAGLVARQGRMKVFASDLGPIGVIRLRETFDVTELILSRYGTLSDTLKRIKLKNG